MMTKRMFSFSLTAFVLAAVLIVAPVSQGRAFTLGDVDFYITNETLFNYNKLADSKNQYYESLSLFANYNKWSAGFTLRGKNFFKQTPNTTLDDFEFDFYRRYVEYNSKYLKVNVGDFYSLLGRGLVLSVLKNDDVLRERTILGGNVHYNRGRLDFKVLGGLIKDEMGDEEWNVAGGELAYRFVDNHYLGAHVSYIDDVETIRNLGKRFTSSFSLHGNKLFNHFSYYVEAAMLQYEQEGRDTGYGFYSNVTYNKSHVTVSLEAKKYKDFDNEMNNPPVGDRVDEISNLNDAAGGRVYLQYSFLEPDISLFFSVGRFKEYAESGNHYYGGIIIEDLWDSLTFNASYAFRDITYPIKRWDANLTYQLNDTCSVELMLKDKRYRDGMFRFQETDHTVQVSFAPYITIYGMHQYSHNKVIGLNHFYSGGVKVYLRGGTVIQLAGGNIRGGQVCSGGQCYVAPPFKGVKFSLLHTFK